MRIKYEDEHEYEHIMRPSIITMAARFGTKIVMDRMEHNNDGNCSSIH